MQTFTIYASEQVYYTKTVQAENEDQVQEMIFNGEISLDNEDITDGSNFSINNIVKG